MSPRKPTPNVCAGPFGVLYDFYIERPWLMQAIGRAVWGIDASVLYKNMEVIASADGGATIADVPCGGGVAFRALRADQNVRYIAADIDEAMLARARRRAAARSLAQVDVVQADMTELPLADDSVDLFVTFSGLHMIREPGRAISEIARCLRPGGEVIGTTFLLDGTRRQEWLLGNGARRGNPEPPAIEELESGFERAGIVNMNLAPRRGFAAFRGRLRRG
jgi:SAM-dependent methyltransferase